ncbi:CTP-dependent diacylglycerol kinase 1 [Yarrowia sp. C11]|nr:CTP-dependent diacylglycerol kinase 1 [Yarrowia sp. C11]KAG5364119.1 CTP-dependent diacylglycerol kinase 1 [Yarrowia sp. E02]
MSAASTGASATNTAPISRPSASLKSQDKPETKTETKTEPTETNSEDLLAFWHNGRFGAFFKKHEIPRKFLHTSIGFITLYLYTRGINLKDVTPVLVGMALFIGTFDFLRLRNKALNKAYCNVMGALMRESEINGINGTIWYLLGLILVFSFASKDVALMAVLLLSWADTAASSVGRAYGHLTPKYKNKSLAGFMGAFIASEIACIFLYGYVIPKYGAAVDTPGQITWSKESSRLTMGVLTALSGLVGAVSESIDAFGIDDNFTIPVLSAIFLTGLLDIFKK